MFGKEEYIMTDNKNDSLSELLKKILIYITLIMLGIPILMYLFVDLADLPINHITDDYWLTFWGSYLGGCIGAVATSATLYVTMKHYNNELKGSKKEARKRSIEDNIPFLIINGNKNGHNFMREFSRMVYKDRKEMNTIEVRELSIDRCVRLNITNCGNGPAVNIRLVGINGDSDGYVVEHFEDRNLNTLKGGPYSLYREGFDLGPDMSADCLIQLLISDGACKSNMITFGLISLRILFEDISGNTLQKDITVSINKYPGSKDAQSTLSGEDVQRYCDQSIQDLVYPKY